MDEELLKKPTGSKISEKACQNAEGLYRILFEQSPNGIVLTDTETEKIIESNKNAYKQLGYTREEFLTLKIGDYEALETPEEIQKHRQKIICNGSDDFETLHRTKSGEFRNVHVWTKIVLLNGHTFFHSIYEDITERKSAEKALINSEELFRVTFQMAAVGIAHLSPDRRFIRINQKLCDIFGYSKEELFSKTFNDLSHPEDRLLILPYIHQMLDGTLQTCSVEKRYIRKDQSIVWINQTISLVRNESGQPKFFISVIEEIDRRKQIEKELKQYSYKLEHLVKERTEELETKKIRLEDVNTALNVMLQKRDKDKQMFEKKILFNVKELIEPLMKNLKNSALDDNQKAYIDTIETFLKEIISPFSLSLHSKFLDFTMSEIRVATLIKEGKTTKEISNILNATPRAIDFHRQNIRKKIGLTNRKVNLASHLLSFTE